MRSIVQNFVRIAALGALAVPASAFAQETLALGGGQCPTPPALHCPDADCPTDRIINPGLNVEMKTRRTYFLDYPCDLQKGEDVTLVLSLHGGGSYGNWQRHYMPLVDYKDEYRLVIATPNSPIRVWTEADDAYLQNIVESLVAQIGNENIKSFWLVGHSQGGMTSNRLLRTDFFANRVDGWLSLSGGRLGGNPERSGRAGPPPQRAPGSPDVAAGSDEPNTEPEPDPRVEAMRKRIMKLRAKLAEPPDADFSFIYATGEHEIAKSGVPARSAWADRYSCDERLAPRDVVDDKAGYVYDGGRQNPGTLAWGLLPGPGKAQIHVYPNCENGRVVADIVRLDKGHTEGLEPKITEELIQLMLSAPGGKLKAL